MLKTVDILLGVSVVMLIVSMAVMVIAQAVIGLTKKRGKDLLTGLSDLLQQIDPKVERAIAEKISTALLTHPLIRGAGEQLGSTIHREEFTKLLMDFAAGNAPKDVLDKLGDDAKAALVSSLKDNGIEDPGKIIDNVRSFALQLEMANPEMAADARHAMAMMKEGNSKLVAKVNTWFDQTMDRVSERFTHETRVVTVVCSLLVAFAIQLDTVGLINRLSVDDKFRQELVQTAIKAQPTLAPRPAPDAATQSATVTKEQREQRIKDLKDDVGSLTELGVMNIAKDPKSWWDQWSKVSVLGVLLSALLLSLGAPFWYNALSQLLRLRSLIAGKDDAQRDIRQTTQTPVSAAGATPQAAGAAAGAGGGNLLAGERGILG